MHVRGAIYNEDAYALGKMLDHSSWQQGEKISRLVTPSDIDACWDNNGFIVYGEFSSSVDEWSGLGKGQRWLYQSAIKNTPHCAALCHHNVLPQSGRAINSKTDVESFQVLLHDHDFVTTEVFHGSLWPTFIGRWFENSLNVRRKLLSRGIFE